MASLLDNPNVDDEDVGTDATDHGASQVQILRLSEAPRREVVKNKIMVMERRLWKKSESWGSDLAKETERRNCFVFYGAAAGRPPPPPPLANPSPSPPLASPAPEDDEVVGYILFTVTGIVSHISKIIVSPARRRQGIGRRLVQAALDFSRLERRVGSVTLHVDSDNDPALELYKGLGFVSEGLLEVSSW